MISISFFKNRVFIFFLLAFGTILGVVIGTFYVITTDMPQVRSLATYQPSAVTRIYSSDNEILAELFVENRDPVPLNIIPEYIKLAIITVEDRNFYSHSGVDIKGILRAVFKDLLARKFVEGASTITQQLVKTLFLSPQKTIDRKIKEAFLAFQLERRYTKDEILEMYLNQIYFGSGAYGVKSAAKIFFDKPVQKLDLAECALIAAMPKSPSRYSPLINYDLSIKRRNIVLNQMLKTGIIDQSEYINASTKMPKIKHKKRNTIAPYFIDHIKKYLEEILGSNSLFKGGLTIYTTLSSKLQKVAEDSVSEGLSTVYDRMLKNDILDPDPQAALVALDIKTGGILAMVGGKNYEQNRFNRATMAKRQPGSAFKPVIYALAIERGFSQNNLILDAPVVFKGSSVGKEWRPKNFTKNYEGEITLRRALTSSKNIPAIRLIEMLGPSAVVQFGYSLGIESNLSPNLSLALGSSELTLLEITSAYSVFPNRGKWIKPYGIFEISNQSGQIIWREQPQRQFVMSRPGAAIVTDMLQGVVKEGTAKKALALKRAIAGKTGTTNEYRDALFIGFSPSIAAGVWVGQDDFTTLGEKETGSKAALPIWMKFMREVLQKRPNEYFDIPDDIVQMHIHPFTGKPEPDTSPSGVKALFKKGTEFRQQNE